MPAYAAFLRGINLGRRRVKSEDLCRCLAELGFDDVATFRASGNAIFATASREAPEKLASRIERQLATSLGYEVRVFLRTAAEVRAMAAHEPFAAELLETSNGKLQVALLPRAPKPSIRKQVLATATGEDRLAIQRRELYWLPSAGISDSQLNLKAIESALGPWTMRTKGTVEQIASRYFSS